MPVLQLCRARDVVRATLRLVGAWVLCQMRAPYRPITAHKLSTPTNCGPPKLRARVLQHP